MTNFLVTPLTFTQLLFLLLIPCILLSLIIIRGFTFKFGKINFTFKGIQTDKRITINDMLLVLEKSQTFKDNEYKILNQEKLKDQMNYAEQKAESLKSMMIDIYFDLLAIKIKDKSAVTLHRDYCNYDSLLDLLYEKIVAKLRFFFKENGLEHTYEEGKRAYEDYIDFKFRSLQNLTTEFFNKRYDDKAIITRKELHDANLLIEKEMRNIISDVFYKALQISEEKTDKVEELKKSYSVFLQTIGITKS